MGLELAGKRVVLGIFVISAFLFVVFAISSYYSAQRRGELMQISCPVGTHAFTVYDLIPLIAMASLVIGAGVYYLMAGRIEGKDRSVKRNTDIILRFLGDDERKVVGRLLGSNGRISQSEITRTEGVSKVKAHRIVKRLASRGIVRTEKQGNTNMVILAREVMEGLA